MHDNDLIEIIAVGLGLAFILGAAANRLRLSPLVGYLLAGVLVGPFTPGFVGDQDLALQLSEIGVVLLMFGVGLHFSFEDLFEVRAIAVPGAVSQIAVATLLGAAMALGLDCVSLELMPADGRDLIVAGALISIMLNPLLFTTLDRRRSRGDGEAVEREAGPVLVPGDHAIVIGYGRVGSVVAQDLGKQGIPFVVIDEDDDLIDRAHRDGIPGIRGNALSSRVLAEASPESARIAAVAIPVALEAGEVLVKLRAANPDLILLARAHSDAEVAHLIERGADHAIMAERVLAHSLADRVVAAFPHRGSDGSGESS